jgi:hypothetical protein
MGVYFMKFFRQKIDAGSYEAAAVFDVDQDGVLDIICGAYWYKGPDFTEKYKICDVRAEGEYFDDFSDYGLDVNGDGRIDIITGGWWGETLRWRENPGTTGLWPVHDIDVCGCIETIRYYDIDGCGTVEVFPNTPGGPQVCYKLILDDLGRGTGKFIKHILYTVPSGHGMGFADIDGDGRMDLVLNGGWLEQPKAGPFSGLWTFHPDYKLDFRGAGIPILGCDITGNGLTDLIVGNGHGYGLIWLEQQVSSDGARSFVRHVIDDAHAQYHDMQLADIDGDGELELVTGKRWRAHCGNDPGDNDPVFIYIYKIRQGRFDRFVIDEGAAENGEHSGVGIYFWLQDLTGNGLPDLVAPGKEGLYLFRNITEGEC